MEEIIDYLLCILYSAIFLVAMRLEKKLKYILPPNRSNKVQSLSAAQIQQAKEDQFVRDQHKMQLRILLVLFACILLSWHNYMYKCKDQSLAECFNFPTDNLAIQSTLQALILNSTLFVGPFYQDYMGPVIEEWVFRNLIGNLINKKFENNLLFIIVSAVIYSLVIQMIVTFIFGAYMAYFFTTIKAIGSCFIIHGYCKFMGIPNIVELFRMNQDDPITKKILLFYAGGIAGFIIECAFLIQ